MDDLNFDPNDVQMECDALSCIPNFEFPPGYIIRPYQPGDEAAWQHLHRIGDPLSEEEFNDELFFAEFGNDFDLLRSRMYYVESPAGEIAGSITAWFTDEEPPRGLIHWVIVHPDHRRLGLGKSMMSHAMQRLAELYQRAKLGTSLERPWAIKIYLDFGFHPLREELDTPAIRQGWERLQERLQHPLLASWLERK